MSEPVPGLFTLVLHTHLPWLAHHGRWPVGEEWLYQSWSASYLPLMRVLRKLAEEDRGHLLTLGMTPVVTGGGHARPSCLQESRSTSTPRSVISPRSLLKTAGAARLKTSP